MAQHGLDRFTTITHKPESWHENQSMDSIEAWAASLLRAEHRAMVRLVRTLRRRAKTRIQSDGRFFAEAQQEGYEQACDDILRALAKRKGG